MTSRIGKRDDVGAAGAAALGDDDGDTDTAHGAADEGVDQVVGDAGGDAGQAGYHGHELEEHETHGHAVNGLDTESLAEDDEAGDEEQDVYRELGVGDGDAVDAVVDYRSQAGDAASGDLVGVEGNAVQPKTKTASPRVMIAYSFRYFRNIS